MHDQYHDVIYICQLLKIDIKEIGPNYIAQLMTNNESNLKKISEMIKNDTLVSFELLVLLITSTC